MNLLGATSDEIKMLLDRKKYALFAVFFIVAFCFISFSRTKEDPVTISNYGVEQPIMVAARDAVSELKPTSIPSLTSLPVEWPKLAGVNIVSMSLYGASPRYTAGAVKNAELVKLNFPGWKLRIYCKNALANGAAGVAVPQDILNTLKKMDVDLHFIQPEVGPLLLRRWCRLYLLTQRF